MIQITNHAYDMGKKRLSLNKKALARHAETAFSAGIEHSDVKGLLRKFIDKKYLSHKSANNIRIYGEVIYFFVSDKLVTLYQVPTPLKKYLKLSTDKG